MLKSKESERGNKTVANGFKVCVAIHGMTAVQIKPKATKHLESP